MEWWSVVFVRLYSVKNPILHRRLEVGDYVTAVNLKTVIRAFFFIWGKRSVTC